MATERWQGEEASRTHFWAWKSHEKLRIQFTTETNFQLQPHICKLELHILRIELHLTKNPGSDTTYMTTAPQCQTDRQTDSVSVAIRALCAKNAEIWKTNELRKRTAEWNRRFQCESFKCHSDSHSPCVI